MIIPYIIIAVLVFVSLYLLIKYIDIRTRFTDLKKEINSQSLNYHLDKITEAGYDFTIKPIRGKKSHAMASKSHSKTNTKKGSFDDLYK
ncbi:MAG: hypothetical protein ACMXYE_01530 [Candidatus Woesearchaeota archaeon]